MVAKAIDPKEKPDVVVIVEMPEVTLELRSKNLVIDPSYLPPPLDGRMPIYGVGEPRKITLSMTDDVRGVAKAKTKKPRLLESEIRAWSRRNLVRVMRVIEDELKRRNRRPR